MRAINLANGMPRQALIFLPSRNMGGYNTIALVGLFEAAADQMASTECDAIWRPPRRRSSPNNRIRPTAYPRPTPRRPSAGPSTSPKKAAEPQRDPALPYPSLFREQASATLGKLLFTYAVGEGLIALFEAVRLTTSFIADWLKGHARTFT